MTGVVKGWCPGALRPMASGDGLLVRVRPPDGALTPAAAAGLAAAAARFGSGLVDLGSRATLQIRGVTEVAHAPLLEALAAHGLIDADPAAEARRSMILDPLAGLAPDRPALGGLAAGWLAAFAGLAARGDLPPPPPKFGVALGSGPRSPVGAAAADLRLWLTAEGAVVAPDGAPLGVPCAGTDAPAVAAAMLARFLAHPRVRSGEIRRVRALVAAEGAGTLAPGADAPLPAAAAPVPGPVEGGVALAAPFGRIDAAALAALADRAAAAGLPALRVAPWRLLVAPGGTAALADGLDLIADPADPRLRVDACPGAPACSSAEIETRPLAARLAAAAPRGLTLHVSGCAKGCARQAPADATLVGRDGRVDVVARGTAAAAPVRTGLDPARTAWETVADALRL
jgi:precorrin-3B synthase